MKKPKRKHRFVVGFTGEGNFVNGKVKGRVVRDDYSTAQPMTLWQAKAMLKDLHSAPKAIFELVPVRIEKVVKFDH